MPTKDELGKLGNTQLAVLCSKVSESDNNYTEQSASKARDLKQEWVSLQTPPEPQLKDQQKKEAQLASWRTQAIEFLAGIL